jgi:hypothetical protein
MIHGFGIFYLAGVCLPPNFLSFRNYYEKKKLSEK